ncbi:MAG: hypothetical protein ACP6KW_12930 [Candidatus Thorarchaeota archaeon]
MLKLAAKVQLDTMDPTILYPVGEAREERIALLTGIVQLVSAALKMDGPDSSPCAFRFMKSERGVIGYCTQEKQIILCEADTEQEAERTLVTILRGEGVLDTQDSETGAGDIKTRSDEVGGLWK